jgi:hypothetical protein
MFMFSKEKPRPGWKWNEIKGEKLEEGKQGNRGGIIHPLLKLAISDNTSRALAGYGRLRFIDIPHPNQLLGYA